MRVRSVKPLLLTVFVAASGATARAGTLAIRILDDAGSPAPACVSLTDFHGRAYSSVPTNGSAIAE